MTYNVFGGTLNLAQSINQSFGLFGFRSKMKVYFQRQYRFRLKT